MTTFPLVNALLPTVMFPFYQQWTHPFFNMKHLAIEQRSGYKRRETKEGQDKFNIFIYIRMCIAKYV